MTPHNFLVFCVRYTYLFEVSNAGLSNFCFVLTLAFVIKISVFLLQVQVNYISQLQAKFNDLQRYAVTTEEVNEMELILIDEQIWLALCSISLFSMYRFQQYIASVLVPVDFDKIIAYRGLFCVVMLLARRVQPQHRWEKLNEKIRKKL